MKAILKIGPFTHMVDLPDRKPDIQTFDFAELEKPASIREAGMFGTPTAPGVPRWHFRFTGFTSIMGEQVATYKYAGKH